MSDSDSDSEFIVWDDVKEQTRAKLMALHKNDIIDFRPSENVFEENVFERWGCISAETKKEAGQRMKVCAFWLPILLQREEVSSTACWALEIGLIDLKEDLSLKHLHKIESLEAVFRALEKGTVKKNQTMEVFRISNMFNSRTPEVLDNAFHWLERTGEPAIRKRVMDLGHPQTCFTALHLVFEEYAKYIQNMSTKLERTMTALMAGPSPCDMARSEEMKKKGNENFQKQQYQDAVKFYSKAIKYYPDNHIIYGNRALCYIRCKKYLKAVGDGKRAILIKPLWAKGHYRYCEALFSLGEVKMAIEANISAQSLCNGHQEGVKDLEQQHQKFIAEQWHTTAEPKVGRPKKNPNKRQDSTHRVDAGEPQPQSFKTCFKIGAVRNIAPQSKVSEVKNNKQPAKNESLAQSEGTIKDTKHPKSEISSKNKKAEPSTTPKKKTKNRNDQPEKEKDRINVPQSSSVQNLKVDLGKAGVCKQLRSMVQDAHAALTDLCSRNAEQAFSQALALLETQGTPKELGLSTLDILLLLFGRASALTDIGQPEELGEAQKLAEKMKSFEERTFECLVFYAIGRVYVKENRFAVALKQFSDSLQMVKNQITPGKLTWPLTKEIVKETQPDYFKEILQSAIELCKFPPIPDAICRLEKCQGHVKAEIYFTDPDFKGFIQICCCQSCIVEYHIACWKTLKTSTFFEKSEKDLMNEPCLTPDCVGQICSIKIFGPTGLMKCKFEAAVLKHSTPQKTKMNQKSSSLKKLKSKEERRLKRKQHKQSFHAKQVIVEILQKKEESEAQSQQKAWLLYRDRVLLQISQNMELLREEKGLHVSALTSSLKPWLELDLSRGNQLAGRMLNWQQEQLETLGQAVELLLERKNRVWARVLIQLLSSCLDINPKLNSWACQLNNAGLNAAQSFIERYAGHLGQLDLSFLFNFSSLQDVIIEKLGTRPELLSSIGLSVTEYLKQAPPHDMRLFIWSLEEHRDGYVSCHAILDDYFDMMDGHCSVLKKSDENQNNSPMKSRCRKKKQKEPKVHFAWPGIESVTPVDEWDQDFFEDDSLSFLHPGDPFRVPTHLREEVANFEDQYNRTRHRSQYNNILDNNPDPTKERLYDYFAQILEEHGPLVAEDPLLVGELENFPPLAQLKIRDAGGFEPFLLESLRFIKMGPCIGLMKHAVSLQQAGHGPFLDDLDVIVAPDTNCLSADLYVDHNADFTCNLDGYSSANTEIYPILPSPYVFGSQPAPLGQSASGVSLTGNDLFHHWTNGDIHQEDLYFLPNEYEEPDLYTSEFEGGVFDTDLSSGDFASPAAEESVLEKHASVQTCQETMRTVAVNTEPNERFESCQGDINKKQKSNRTLELQIQKIANGCEQVDVRYKEDIAVLKEDIQKINTNIQVTNQELMLFQQKLEEEVEKDQMEKRANQQVLKSLKQETEGLLEDQRSISRTIQDVKNSYDAKLSEFLEQSNRSAAEKMSLEDEIQRCTASMASATRRSRTAQLSVVESSRDQGLYGLYRELADAKALLTKLDEAAHRFPTQDLEIMRSRWRANVQEVEKKISTAETQYQEQMDQVKNGRRVDQLLPVTINNQPEPPLSAAAKPLIPPTSAPSSHSCPALAQLFAAAKLQNKPPTKTLEKPHSTVFDKALDRLATMFPDYTRSDLMKFIQELRSANGGTLSSMGLQDMISEVTQRILDHQEKRNSAAKSRGIPARCVTPPYVAPVWQKPAPQVVATSSKPLNIEDPCIICHEDMNPDDVCVLNCRHGYHKKCIRSWLNEQSTCPTCRDHAVLPDDFPALTSRRRQAP